MLNLAFSINSLRYDDLLSANFVARDDYQVDEQLVSDSFEIAGELHELCRSVIQDEY